MPERRIKALAGLFLALLAAWLGLLAFEGRRSAEPPLWPGAKEARRLALGSAVLARAAGGGWSLEAPFKFPADTAAIDKLLARLASARLSEPLAGPEGQAAFEVSGSSAIKVQGWADPSGTPALDLWVGKAGSDYDAVFVRREGSEDVLEARGLARYEVEKAPGAWADPIACRVLPGDATGLELSGPKSSWAWAKEGDHWIALPSRRTVSDKAKAEAIEALLKSLSPLEAESVEPGGLAAAEHILIARSAGADAKEVELRISKEEAGSARVARGDLPGFVYVVPAWRLEPLKKLAALLRGG